MTEATLVETPVTSPIEVEADYPMTMLVSLGLQLQKSRANVRLIEGEAIGSIRSDEDVQSLRDLLKDSDAGKPVCTLVTRYLTDRSGKTRTIRRNEYQYQGGENNLVLLATRIVAGRADVRDAEEDILNLLAQVPFLANLRSVLNRQTRLTAAVVARLVTRAIIGK